MKKKPEQLGWFENQREIPGLVTMLKKHYYKHSGLSGIFRPLPYEIDYTKLLEVSEGNQQFVQNVKQYVQECYFDEEGKPKEYGGFERIGVYYAPKREMTIPDPSAKDWIHVVFDRSYFVKMISGPVGHDYVTDNGMNKSFLYSMSKML